MTRDEKELRNDEAAIAANELGAIQAQVDEWIQQYGVRYFSELTNLAQLVEEVGELARIMSRQFGDQSAKPGEAANELGDELADILFVAVCIANQTGTNLGDAWRKNIAKKTSRDQDRHHQNTKLNR